MKRAFLLLPFVLLTSVLFAQNSRPGISNVPEIMTLTSFLGETLESLTAQRGLPPVMEAVRGPSEGQDSVVFRYEDHLSFFWTDGRVWQVRVDKDYLNEGILRMGMSPSEVISILGLADIRRSDYLIYTLPRNPYPASCALYFEEGLSDLYVYRSDF